MSEEYLQAHFFQSFEREDVAITDHKRANKLLFWSE
jgi:hypothetical protein